jgi:predicted O-linked N-acetylglucosamine transferase (SPINDLY family)
MTPDPAPSAEVQKALAALYEGGIDQARERLETLPATETDDGRCAALGMVHLAAGRFVEARTALRAAVALGDAAPATLLNLAIAEDHTGDRERARALMQTLRTQLPDWDEPALRYAESLRRANEYPAAEAAYEQTLEINPRRPEALISLALLQLRRGGAVRAQLLVLRCCAIAPDNAQAWDVLGMSLMLSNDPALAETAFVEAQQRDPHNVEIALRKIDAAVASGTEASEVQRLEAASLEDPLNEALLVARGTLLLRLVRYDEAVETLEAATALAPGSAQGASALAMALIRCSRIAQAIPALERAIALTPDDLSLRNNHAAALARVHRHREAREELEHLIAQHGELPGFLCNLTNALVSLGLQEEGCAMGRRAVELNAEPNLAWRTLTNALPYRDGIGGAELLEAYRKTNATILRTAPPALTNAPDPHRRICVGLLSPTLKTHPVGWLTIAAFESLDATAFEIVCCAQPQSDDALQRRFRAVASTWHVVDRAGGRAASEQIRALGIDVLIDLSGYGDQGLMTLCADRLAPVQMKWVGSQNHTTGLDEMDWFITDRWETPPGFERFYSERLLRLPDGYVCYSPPAYAPEVGPLPAERNGHMTFGCFNNLAKVTPRVIATWSAILRRVNSARLVLKCHQLDDAATRERIRAAFVAHGIDPTRIDLRGSSPHRALLAEYNDIDIVLDPFPYSGGLTTCEALWMGVPTVAIPGEIFASRHSTSHLSNAGLADWVARDLPDYEHIAVQRAANVAALAWLRAGLRAQVKSSPLCDAPRFGRNFGAALRHVWMDWCARQQESA